MITWRDYHGIELKNGDKVGYTHSDGWVEGILSIGKNEVTMKITKFPSGEIGWEKDITQRNPLSLRNRELYVHFVSRYTEGTEIMTHEISFDVSKQDADLISQIVKRAHSELQEINRLELGMDLTALHANGCPLRLEDLLKADYFSLVHDLYGIRENIDRDTGKLVNNFLPRFRRKK